MTSSHLSQQPFQDALRAALHDRRARNSRYSLRSFAKSVGMHPAALSEVLNGKRRVSRVTAAAVLRRLPMTLHDIERIVETLAVTKQKLTLIEKRAMRQVAEVKADQYGLIAEWQCYAILSLVACRDFDDDPEWIARRLGISAKVARESLLRLRRLGLVKRSRSGRLKCTHAAVTSSEDVLDAAIRRSHAESLELAHTALSSIDVMMREFTAVTLAMDPRDVPAAKTMIREFRDRFMTILEAGQKRAVFRMCVQFFPLTKED